MRQKVREKERNKYKKGKRKNWKIYKLDIY